MKSQDLTAIYSGRANSMSHSLVSRIGMGAVLMLLLSTGCSQLKLGKPLVDTNFKIQVTEKETGTYEVSGDADFPDDTKVAVAAVRYLQLSDRSPNPLRSKPTYSILDYQLAQVQKGKWQSSLQLRRPIADGQYQEIWQIEQSRLKISLKPEEQVIFLATLAPVAPVDQLQALEQQLAKQNLKIDRKLVYTTASGQQYVQISQSQAIAPPAISANLANLPPEAINSGWGRRYLMPGEPIPPYKFELPDHRKTDAPSQQNEFLR